MAAHAQAALLKIAKAGGLACRRGPATELHFEYLAAFNPTVAQALVETAATVPDLLALIEDMSRFIGKMALQDYARFNEAPINARRAQAALTAALEDTDGR